MKKLTCSPSSASQPPAAPTNDPGVPGAYERSPKVSEKRDTDALHRGVTDQWHVGQPPNAIRGWEPAPLKRAGRDVPERQRRQGRRQQPSRALVRPGRGEPAGAGRDQRTRDGGPECGRIQPRPVRQREQRERQTERHQRPGRGAPRGGRERQERERHGEERHAVGPSVQSEPDQDRIESQDQTRQDPAGLPTGERRDSRGREHRNQRARHDQEVPEPHHPR